LARETFLFAKYFSGKTLNPAFSTTVVVEATKAAHCLFLVSFYLIPNESFWLRSWMGEIFVKRSSFNLSDVFTSKKLLDLILEPALQSWRAPLVALHDDRHQFGDE